MVLYANCYGCSHRNKPISCTSLFAYSFLITSIIYTRYIPSLQPLLTVTYLLVITTQQTLCQLTLRVNQNNRCGGKISRSGHDPARRTSKALPQPTRGMLLCYLQHNHQEMCHKLNCKLQTEIPAENKQKRGIVQLR